MAMTELDPADKALLKDIQAFNQEYAAAGWHIQDKVVTEDLSRILLVRSSIASAQFLYVAWKSAILTDTHFSNVEFQQAEFAGAHLRAVTFRDCKFVVCSFAKATLTDCRFINCTSEELNARDAVFEGCQFETFADGSGVYGSASLNNCSFERSRLDNSSFYATKFNDVPLRQCELKNVIFAGIQGFGLLFEDATLFNCGFERSRYGSVTFSRGQSKGLTFNAFDSEKLAIEDCASIQALTVCDSTWTAPAIGGCPAVSELTLNRSRMKDLVIERCQIAYFEMQDTEVSGGSRIADCSIAGLNLERSSLRLLRMSNCTVAVYLIADGATMDGVVLGGLVYAPDLQFSARDVKYLNASAEFGSR
jgi:fluoroquinolone resistance protein